MLTHNAVVVIFDPLPRVTEGWRVWKLEGETNEAEDEKYDPPSHGREDEKFRGAHQTDEEGGTFRTFQPTPADSPWRENNTRRLQLGNTTARKGRYVETKPQERVFIEQTSLRYQDDTDLDEVFKNRKSMLAFKSRLGQTRPTRDDLHESALKHSAVVSIAPLLSEIFFRDTSALLKHLNQIADEIDIQILDDTKMEDRLVLWRQIISRAHRELPELRASMRALIGFEKAIAAFEPLQEAGMSDPNYRVLSEAIEKTIERLQKTSASLNSNMSLLDSKRSIAEAHAIARLTELAFIFIPLSFAATVFGMQIESFAEPAPNGMFFLVAIVAISFSYLMRAFMRSQWLGTMQTKTNDSIERYAERHDLPVHPRSVPTRLIIWWAKDLVTRSVYQSCSWATGRIPWAYHVLSQNLGLLPTFLLTILLLSIIPIGILWSRPLDAGIRLAISLGTVVTIAITTLIAATLRSSARNSIILSINYDYSFSDPVGSSRFSQIQDTSHYFLIVWLGDRRRALVRRWMNNSVFRFFPLAILVLIPLALIWTRPLAMGIKVGLTVGILLLGLFFFSFRLCLTHTRSFG